MGAQPGFYQFCRHKVFSSLGNSSSRFSETNQPPERKMKHVAWLIYNYKVTGLSLLQNEHRKSIFLAEGLNILTWSLRISFSSQPPLSFKCPCHPEQMTLHPIKRSAGDPQGTRSSWSSSLENAPEKVRVQV